MNIFYKSIHFKNNQSHTVQTVLGVCQVYGVTQAEYSITKNTPVNSKLCLLSTVYCVLAELTQVHKSGVRN